MEVVLPRPMHVHLKVRGVVCVATEEKDSRASPSSSQ